MSEDTTPCVKSLRSSYTELHPERGGCLGEEEVDALLLPHPLSLSILLKRFRVQCSGFRVKGSGCRVQGAGFRVQGSGFRVQV